MSGKCVRFIPSALYGEMTVPPSKSEVHRAVICAAMANGISTVYPIAMSNDIKATVKCAEALGAKISVDGDRLTVDGTGFGNVSSAELNCFESGSTLRFFIPIAAAMGVEARFTGEGRLPQRPIGIYLDALPKAGVECITSGGLPLDIRGRLKSGSFEMPGNVSSQFITGLMLALAGLDGDSEIILTTELESAGYIDLTAEVMEAFGVKVYKTESGYKIPGGQRFKARDFRTHGDWSQAAFFLSAGALKNMIMVHNVYKDTTQGDKEICSVLRRFGTKITIRRDCVRAAHSELIGIRIDASQIPDLVPVIAVVAGVCRGETVIYNAARLRIKESDRLSAIANAINKIGGKVTETKDGLIINGVKRYYGCEKNDVVDGCNDHRILMSMAIASLVSEMPITVSDADSIKKSYPDFYEDFNSMGGKADVFELR